MNTTTVFNSQTTAFLPYLGTSEVNPSSLERVCQQLLDTFRENHFPYSARQFQSVLNAFELNLNDREFLLQLPYDRHVLVNNAYLKVVLIHWKPGDTTSVHGHPSGGCMFKVLHGQVVENRYAPDSRELLSTHLYHRRDQAYIDDTIAVHDVSNLSLLPAISLHAYTPGSR